MKRFFARAPLAALACSAALSIVTANNAVNKATVSIIAADYITPYAAWIDFGSIQYAKTAVVSQGNIVGNNGCLSVDAQKIAVRYATLEIGSLLGDEGAEIPPTAISITQAGGSAPVSTLDGAPSNTEVIAIAHNKQVFAAGSPITILQRTASTSGKLGHYCITPSFEITVPAYQPIQDYQGSVTMTVFET